MVQKKLYVKPEETIVEMKARHALLLGSGGEEGDARYLDFTDTDLDN